MTADGIWFQTATRESLSPAGAARREAMLRELDGAMRRRNLSRTGARACIVVAPLLVLACVVWAWPRGHGAAPAPGNANLGIVAQGGGPAEASFQFIRFVGTDPTVTRRLSGAAVPNTVRMISDDELQSLLASMGRDSGFVRTGGRVILVTDVQRPRREERPAEGDGHSSI